jgi:hypothetical protein
MAMRVCVPRPITEKQMIDAADVAVSINPTNQPHSAVVARALEGGPPHRARIAVVISKRWPASGVRLTVKFMDNPEAALRRRILSHMNAWGKTANVVFTETNGTGQVRLARLDTPEDGGYWSYVGTEILTIAKSQPTLNLEAFTMKTSEREFTRVVRHEAGHTLGFPHEHMRRELVDLIDREAAIRSFMKSQGWSRQEVINQVLTPLEESSIQGTLNADSKSIMCYQIDGSITKNHKPILGGLDIDESDAKFASSIYPKAVAKKTAKMKIPKRPGGFA